MVNALFFLGCAALLVSAGFGGYTLQLDMAAKNVSGTIKTGDQCRARQWLRRLGFIPKESLDRPAFDSYRIKQVWSALGFLGAGLTSVAISFFS